MNEKMESAEIPARASEVEGFQDFYARYAAYVWGCSLARTRTHSDAEDLASAVWLDVFRQFSRFQEAEPRQFLHQLVRWRAVDLFRSKHGDSTFPMEQEQLFQLLTSDIQGQGTFDMEHRLCLQQALAQESPEDVGLLLGRYVEEKTWEELAVQHQLHRNTVYKRATDALLRVREFLAQALQP